MPYRLQNNMFFVSTLIQDNFCLGMQWLYCLKKTPNWCRWTKAKSEEGQEKDYRFSCKLYYCNNRNINPTFGGYVHFFISNPIFELSLKLFSTVTRVTSDVPSSCRNDLSLYANYNLTPKIDNFQA